MEEYKAYCNSLTEYSRFKTREVAIGDIPMGADNPIRIQSMTTTNTMDTIATVEQTIRMVEAGCEYVRITAPSIKEAENLANIKKELRNRGYNVPLIADIHFTPNAAEVAARHIEKVRVNPGNYVDKKRFHQIDYTDAEYLAEIERIRERFSPLVKICKEYGTAMRIGTNHGSLSDRIMSRYGDTPAGMVESALEFLRICEDLNYYDVVLSMKSSNTQVMVQAYRLLVQRMVEEEMMYPLHLGVTEAGGGEDGRIKSAVGIGALLEDGLGDTIRVSLTEPPENESPVAIALANRYKSRAGHKSIPEIKSFPKDPVEYEKRKSFAVENIGGENLPVVVSDLSRVSELNASTLSLVGYNFDTVNDKWNISDVAPDYLYLGKKDPNMELPEASGKIYDYEVWKGLQSNKGSYPLFTLEEYSKENASSSDKINFVEIRIEDTEKEIFDNAANNEKVVFVLTTDNEHGMAEQRRLFFLLLEKGCANPVVIKRSYEDVSEEDLLLRISTDFGALFIDGFGDGAIVEEVPSKVNRLGLINRVLFGTLQAARVRISKTEYIACPSCGRTLFDLVDVTNEIRKRTEHLKGVKIGIMGCIVNGPGEMADADYGYVGSGVGKITLYKGKEVVRRNITSETAVEELIELIKEDGRWVEKKTE